jgi:hypothetical protein
MEDEESWLYGETSQDSVDESKQPEEAVVEEVSYSFLANYCTGLKKFNCLLGF